MRCVYSVYKRQHYFFKTKGPVYYGAKFFNGYGILFRCKGF